MKYKKIFIVPFQSKRDDTLLTAAVISGLVVGTAIAALFATKRGKEIKRKITTFSTNLFTSLKSKTERINGQQKLGNLIDDVRGHIKQSADGLLGPEDKRHHPSEIHVAAAGTNAWKHRPEKSIFPNTPDSSIRIN